jgi:hypothetical protein
MVTKIVVFHRFHDSTWRQTDGVGDRFTLSLLDAKRR